MKLKFKNVEELLEDREFMNFLKDYFDQRLAQDYIKKNQYYECFTTGDGYTDRKFVALKDQDRY